MQKFNVVKCLKHIPKELRGKVVEDRFCNLYVEESGVEIRKTLDEYHYYNLKPTDTFPLPKQGDKVEHSFDSKNWGKSDYVSRYKGNFIIDLDCYIDDFPYIRPIEKESNRDKFCDDTYKEGDFENMAEKLETVMKKLDEIGIDIGSIKIKFKTNKS